VTDSVQTTTGKKNKSMTQRRLIPTYIFLVIFSLFSVFPLYWMITAATNKSLEVAQGKIWFGTNLAENFTKLIRDEALGTSMWNSFFYATVQMLLCLLICSLAGYGFELYHDKAKDKLFAFLLLGMMIPQVATMIPLFRMMSGGKLLNTVWAFILPQLSTPFMIMMFRQNSRNFPPDIMEAARLDGLSEIRIFFSMYMPVMKSTYAAAAVITFMNAWNAYLWPKVVMTKNQAQTMPMLIANLAGGYTIDYGELMLGVLFCSIPTMIIFFILQKQFAEGITGSVK
jgi:lactose/L-arabinose transport system permease protein